MTPFGIGIIGCGNISSTYFRLAPLFGGLEIRACADINGLVAEARADEFGVRADSVEALLGADDIDLVVNLTVPTAHFEITRQALGAGKHVYSEKPVVLDMSQGRELMSLSAKSGLRVGSAPDTFLGGAHQQARKELDAGTIGRAVTGTCHFMAHGMEHWHPNPEFFYQPGAGPVLDLGPYYVTQLINLLGPVGRVAAMSSTPSPTRTLTSAARMGETIPVATPTTVHALLEFVAGATITLSCSWDVWAHRHAEMELYGETGTLFLTDPDMFGGQLQRTDMTGRTETLPVWDHPLGRPNRDRPEGALANYRMAGVADMIDAIRHGRDHRCSLERAVHAVDVMTSILRSGETGTFIDLDTSCTRPEPLSIEQAQALLAPNGGA